MLRPDLKVTQPLQEQHKLLIIGCGNSCAHAQELHGSEDFYTVDCRDVPNPHLIGDIRDAYVQDYLNANTYDLICIEAVPVLIDLDSKENVNALLNRLFSMLSANGTLIILNSLTILNDKDLHNTLFQYVNSFTMYQGKLKNSNDSNCTIVAAKTSPTEAVTNYINTALKIKYFSRMHRVFNGFNSYELFKPVVRASELPSVNLLENKGLFAAENQRESTPLLEDKKPKKSSCCALV